MQMRTCRSFRIARLTLGLALLFPFGAPAQTWTPIGPRTARVYNLFFSPLDSNLIYAYGILNRSFGGNTQLMASSDAGASFSFLHSQSLINDIAFHPESPDTFWVVGPSVYWRTVDGGASFQQYNLPGGESRMTDIVHAPAGSGDLYMMDSEEGETTLYRSQDGGIGWELKYQNFGNTSNNLDGLFFRPGNPDTLFTTRTLPEQLSDGREVWRSVDGGATWECLALSQPFASHWYLRPEVYFHPQDESLVYATGEVFEGAFGLVSHNGGASFQLLIGPWGGSEAITPKVLDDGRILVLASGNAYLSDDLGVSWTPVFDDPDTYPVNSFSFIEPQDVISSPASAGMYFIAYEDIFYRTLDAGENWNADCEGFGGTTVFSIQTSMADPDVVHAQTEGGIFRTEDRGQTWSVINISMQSYNRISQYNADWIVRWDYTHPWLSNDGGRTWRELTELGNTTDFAFHPDHPNIIACIANPNNHPPGVYVSTDGGFDWQLSDGFDGYNGSLAFDPGNPDRLMVLNGTGRLYESLDAGGTLDLFYFDEVLLRYSMQPDGGGAVAMTSVDFNGLFTADRAVPEFPHSFDVPDPSIRLDYAPGEVLVAQRWDAVFYSWNHGAVWTGIFSGPGLTPTPERTCGITSDGTVYVAAGDQGVLMSTDALEVREPSGLASLAPGTFILLPAYPNPFNAATTLAVELAQPSALTVTIHDVLGREVVQLLAGRQLGPGQHRLVWDARDAASGSYFVTAGAPGGEQRMQRIVLVR